MMNLVGGSGALLQSSRRLSIAGIALIVVTILTAALTVWDLREEADTSSRQDLANLGIVLVEQTSRSMQAIDLVLQETQNAVLAAGVETPEKFGRLMATQAIHETLSERLKNLPQASAITLVGADGKLVNFSRSWPIPEIDVSDRDYYRYLSEHDDRTAFVSYPIRNKSNGAWTFYLARRVSGPGGEFLGIVLGAMELHYIEEFYKAITSRDGGSVTLLNRDGTILVRYPRIDDKIAEKMPLDSPWYPIVEQGGGTYRSPGYLDGIVRVVSVHPLADYPLVVNVTMSEEAALANWRRQSTFISIGAVCIALGFLALFRALSAQFHELEQNRASLELNTTELQQTADALRKSERRLTEKSQLLETTLEHMDQGIIVVDADRAGSPDR